MKKLFSLFLLVAALSAVALSGCQSRRQRLLRRRRRARQPPVPELLRPQEARPLPPPSRRASSPRFSGGTAQ